MLPSFLHLEGSRCRVVAAQLVFAGSPWQYAEGSCRLLPGRPSLTRDAADTPPPPCGLSHRRRAEASGLAAQKQDKFIKSVI